MPAVSVIVPAYKVEPFLRRCVDSILGQTCGDFELILVDDGSPDGCPGICDDYAAKDSRVHVIHQENGGLSAARNAGIDWAFANSDSRWLAFIDGDDWVHRDYLRILLAAARSLGAPIAMCGFTATDRDCADAAIEEEKPILLDAEQAYADQYAMCMTACCKLYDKALFSTLRFPVGKLHEDAYITHLLLFAAGKAAVCHGDLYYYFSNPESITRAKWSKNRLDELDAHERRLAYLQERGYQKAYRREVREYVIALYTQAGLLMELGKKERAYRREFRQLKAKLMPALRLGRKNGLFPLEKQNLWIYEIAFPIKPLWYALYLAEKMGKKLSGRRQAG